MLISQKRALFIERASILEAFCMIASISLGVTISPSQLDTLSPIISAAITEASVTVGMPMDTTLSILRLWELISFLLF